MAVAYCRGRRILVVALLAVVKSGAGLFAGGSERIRLIVIEFMFDADAAAGGCDFVVRA